MSKVVELTSGTVRICTQVLLTLMLLIIGHPNEKIEKSVPLAWNTVPGFCQGGPGKQQHEPLDSKGGRVTDGFRVGREGPIGTTTPMEEKNKIQLVL